MDRPDAREAQSEGSRLPAGVARAGQAAQLEVQRIASDALFGGGRELEIEHAGALYRLRVTALGRLILTK